jgi:glyoxylase-like metal-dependent hydrolase (beta-lactamase superfamily II)
MTRRGFNGRLAALAAAAAAGPALLPREARGQFADEFTRKELAPGIYAIVGRGGNALVVAGEGGSVLIDTKVKNAGEDLKALASEGAPPLAAVINTHHHADHTGGNPAFTSDLPVYAHEKAVPRVRAYFAGQGEDPEPFLPSRDAMDHESLEVAGVSMELAHPGPAHTDNDVSIFFPERNVLHTGDLVFHRLHPFIDRSADASTAGWMDACRTMYERCDDETIVVPGHGEVTDRSGIERQLEYFKAAREAVGEVVAAGGPRAAMRRIRLPIFEGMGFERLRTRALEAIYDEMVEAG